MTGGQVIAVLALLIPLLSIIFGHLRRWQRLEVEAAKRDVDVRRHHRTFDLLDQRVGDIEAHVTSREYQINREIGRLAGKP